jgi:hypothetical protein
MENLHPLFRDICKYIVEGKYPQNELNAIAQAINHRREVLRPVFNVGDEVQFLSDTKPNYLVGEKATVIKVNNKRVKVKMLKPIGRFAVVTVPKSLLEIIKNEV